MSAPEKPEKSTDHRRVTTPLLMQTHASECGAACLGSILGYFGRWVPFTELRGKCEVSRDGSTAASLKRAAEYYGLECQGTFIHGTNRIRKLPLPLILFWQYSHFLILEGYDREQVFLNDPAAGRRKLSWEEFDEGFSKVALQFRAGPEFQPGGSERGVLQRLPVWLHGARGALAYAFACGMALALLALLTPVLLGIFVDRALGENIPLGGTIAGALAAAAALVYVITWLKQRCLQRLTIRLSVIAGNRCVSHFLRLPIDYFSHRLVGELIARILSIDRIVKGVTEHVVAVLIELVMSMVFLIAMWVYAPTLALIVLGLAALNATLLYLVKRVHADASHTLRREQGLLLGTGALMLNHANILRMTGEDDHFFSRWGGHQARELNARQRFAEITHINLALPGLFMILGNAAVLAIGARLVMTGEMTLGVMVGFYIVATLFLEPVGRFVQLADARQALETDMQRLEDITESPEDPNLSRRNGTDRNITTFNGRLQLAGQVELRNITYGHNPGRPPLIKNFNLTIKPGQRIAIVGPSGSGKSTLANLVAGIYQPWSGEVLFDGHPRREIPDEVLSRSLSMVDQHIVLFSASVRDNITLWNPAVPDDNLLAAARDAGIHDEILERPRGYATRVDEDGSNFSGGQRQRIEIARALVNNPTILLLDEATSALDAATEEHVDDALRRRGVTCLIVAHRLSAIRDCDEIIVLDKGEEAQRGAHDELMQDRDGLYYRLVQAG